MVAAVTTSIRGRDSQLVELIGNFLIPVPGFLPLQHHQPDLNLVGIAGKNPYVVSLPADIFTVCEPLHERVAGVDECSGESVGCLAARTEAFPCHAALDEDDPIAQPR